MPFSRKLSSLHKLSLVERALDAGMVEIPMDGGEWTVSPGALIVLGLPETEQPGIGKVMADLIHPDDRLAFFKAVALIQSATVPPPRIYRIRTSGGSIRYLSFHFDALASETGRPQRFVGVIRDVTTEAIAGHAQDKIGRLLDTLMSGLDLDVVWRTDAVGRVLDHFAKGNLARTVQPFEHQWHRFVSAEDANRIQEKLRLGAPFSVFVDVLCEDGVTRQCVDRGFPLRDEKGRITEWCGVVNEVLHASGAVADLAGVAEHVTGSVIRAGCGILNWPHEEFARRSGLSTVTVRRMASSPERLVGLFRKGTVDAALRAFVDGGLDLRLSNDGKVVITL